jgi:hypothetical protein
MFCGRSINHFLQTSGKHSAHTHTKQNTKFVFCFAFKQRLKRYVIKRISRVQFWICFVGHVIFSSCAVHMNRVLEQVFPFYKSHGKPRSYYCPPEVRRFSVKYRNIF